MHEVTGIDNEFEFVKYFNGKKISELNPKFRELVDKLYPFEKEKSIIKSWRNHYPQKTDIFIRINGVMKGISIKKGIKNSIHVERITGFIHFLIDNKIEEDIVIEYLKYHYADGSINGTGKNRLSCEEYKMNNQSAIDSINKAFNDEKILRKAIEKFVIKGNNSDFYIDAMIYGTIDDFLWITKQEIIDIILSKRNDYSTAVHFGPLVCQPKNRCLNFNFKYEKDRFCVQLKWYSLFDDIIEYMNIKEMNKRNQW